MAAHQARRGAFGSRGYWGSPFAAWLRRYGVSRVARELHMTPHGVYRWVYGRTAPRPEAARAIERISGGAVTIREVYAHRDTIGGETR